MNRLEIFQKVYGTNYVFTAKELERLRQVTDLIVKECAYKAANIAGGYDSSTYYKTLTTLKEHFGIK